MINSQQQTIVSLSRNLLFPRELMYRLIITVEFSLYAKKKKKKKIILGFEKKVKFGMDHHW